MSLDQPTPRTDAATKIMARNAYDSDTLGVDPEFARKLERELAACLEALEKLCRATAGIACREREQAIAVLAATKGDA